MQKLTIYAPPLTGGAAFGEDGSYLGIARGSAIVGPGSADDLGGVVLDYEGALYDDAGYRERLMRAAGRHVRRYPTVARSYFPRWLFEPVGTADVEADGSLWQMHIEQPEVFEAWAGEAE